MSLCLYIFSKNFKNLHKGGQAGIISTYSLDGAMVSVEYVIIIVQLIEDILSI